MPLNPETKPEKENTHIEKRPKKDDSALVRKLGDTAIKGARKDKPKK